MLGQVEPDAAHTLLTQHPPPQPLLSQQAWPAEPHCTQTPFCEVSDEPLHTPWQDGWPASPH